MKRKVFSILLALMLVVVVADSFAATVVWTKKALTGGGATALDGINGTILNNGDMAFVTVSGVVYTYVLDSSSGATAASPFIISPATNAGDKRWILQSPVDVELDLSAAGATILAASLKKANYARATNSGQAAEDVSNDLPTIATNLCLDFTVATTQSNYNRLCAPEGDSITIDGNATTYDCVGFASGALVQKNMYQICSFRTGAATFVWQAFSGIGTLTGYNGVKP